MPKCSRPPMRNRVAARDMKRVSTLGLLLLSFVVGTGLCEIAARTLYPHWREFYSGRFMQREFVPGHGSVNVGRGGFDGYFAQSDGDFRVRITLNELGQRNPEPASAANGTIWVVADSFGFGWGVERNQTYAEVIERILQRPVYNLSSPGTDICGYQMLLARMPAKAKPAALIVGLTMENDVRRYSCKRGEGPHARPENGHTDDAEFSLTGVKRSLIANSALYNFFAVTLKRIEPVTEFLIFIGLVERPHAGREKFNTGDLARRVASTVDELLYLRSMVPKEIPFAVLVAPARFDVRDRDPIFSALRKNLRQEIRRRGIETIDPIDDFRAAGFSATHFAHDGHWLPLGHEIAGRRIADWLKTQRVIPNY